MAVDVLNNLLVSQGGVPPYTEATRLGTGWYTISTTAITAVAAVPTTTAGIEIYNNTTGPGAIALVVDTLHAFQLLSTAAVQTYGIWAMVTTQKAAPTNTALAVYSNSGRPTYSTTASGRIVTIQSSSVVNNGWRPWGSVQPWATAAATPGNAWHADVNGRLIVPPGASLCVTVAGSIATASSFQVGASWYEAPLTMVV